MDRNSLGVKADSPTKWSLSARRAWIEIVRFTASLILPLSLSARRAWIEIFGISGVDTVSQSLSARRAWIEIRQFGRRPRTRYVALRKESVDRNKGYHRQNQRQNQSLSARRAWIEMLAPRLADMSNACRSPQGERG